jgi:hypothetical protein
MAQRKSTPSRPSAKPGTPKSGTAKSGSAKPGATSSGTAKSGATKSGGATSPSARGSTTATTRPETKRPTSAQRPAPPRKPGKSIVNQKQRPWGLIIAATLVVVFAAAVVTYAITRSPKVTDPYRQPALADATKISGVTYRAEPDHTHVQGLIKYDASPPVGGNHSQYWVDCTGTVYANAIANENAVHGLEHGAVWITYRPGLPKSEVDTLAKYVSGQDRMFMTPYPGLKTNVSLQSWGYQLFLDSPTDPRIQQFIDALRYNPKTTPEYGADCSQPTFITHPSTFGHPLWAPAT